MHQKNATKHYTAKTFGWIGITHVSQRWREIALTFPCPSTHIPFQHPKWAKEMIARSHPASLIATGSYDPSMDSSQAKLLSFLQQHLSCVQVLDIQITIPLLVAELFSQHPFRGCQACQYSSRNEEPSLLQSSSCFRSATADQLVEESRSSNHSQMEFKAFQRPYTFEA